MADRHEDHEQELREAGRWVIPPASRALEEDEWCPRVTYRGRDLIHCTLLRGHDGDHEFEDGTSAPRCPRIVIDRVTNEKTEVWEP